MRDEQGLMSENEGGERVKKGGRAKGGREEGTRSTKEERRGSGCRKTGVEVEEEVGRGVEDGVRVRWEAIDGRMDG